MFHLNKWYLDLVTADGAAVICYAATLRWGPARLEYASILVDVPGESPLEASTLRPAGQPVIDQDVLSWHSAPLGVSGQWQRRQPGVSETLLDGKDGAIVWSCPMPLAAAQVQYGDRCFTGSGYVESLEMTLSPTHLPLNTLRWGRHVSRAHSLVWIEWTGRVPGQWIWCDGVRLPSAVLGNDGMHGGASGVRLEIHESRDIRNRRLLSSLGALPDAIASRCTGSLSTLREHKMAARSTLYAGDVPLDDGEGWTIHEVVEC